MPELIVQMGHCYRKSGATGTTGEQQFATAVGAAAVRLLDGKNGWDVRAVLADIPTAQYAGDGFVAVHCDGSTNPTARGASVGYQNNAGRARALAWKRAYTARGWSGGWRPDNYTAALQGYYGVRNARNVGNDSALIVECGFLTNPSDRALLTGAGGPERVALAIGDAFGITATTGGDDDVTTAREVWAYKNPKLDEQDMRAVLVAARESASKAAAVADYAQRTAAENQRRFEEYREEAEARLAEMNGKLDAIIAAMSS